MGSRESFREIAARWKGDMVFPPPAWGGTGNGSISIAARIAKSKNLLVIAFVTTPHQF
jgi:cell division GTPase FtsZ